MTSIRANRKKVLLLVRVAMVIAAPLADVLTACSQAPPPSPETAPNPTAAGAADNRSTPGRGGSANRRSEPPVPAGKPPTQAQVTPVGLEKYAVMLSATERLTMPGPPGALSVWIGASRNVPNAEVGTASTTAVLGSGGQTAMVKPFALGISVEPVEGFCEKIDPSGSEVQFKLTPTSGGTFNVGADVKLYESPDCSGIPVPKSAKSVEVNVKVNTAGVVEGGLSQLGSTLWQHFLTFWGALVTIAFALILFLIRKKLYKWFGFSEKQ